jgi:2-polyprenyl-3-methyl-5-hydroxy-6-metoxy-1,4-benzoquinol methylase
MSKRVSEGFKILSRIKKMFRNRGPSVWGRFYKNLPIKPDYRVHEVAFELIKDKLGHKKSIKVLDVATGTGAFSQRIADYFPGWDLEVNDFEAQALVTDFRVSKNDLNDRFSEKFSDLGYELVIALEIIEHLENPWNFLREIRKLLSKDGLLVLSTPNSDSALDRLTYLLHGHSFYFSERGYVNSGGHITSVPDWLFKKIAQSMGCKMGEAGYPRLNRLFTSDIMVAHYDSLIT